MQNTHAEANSPATKPCGDPGVGPNGAGPLLNGDASHHLTDTCGSWPGNSHLWAMKTVPAEITSSLKCVCRKRSEREIKGLQDKILKNYLQVKEPCLTATHAPTRYIDIYNTQHRVTKILQVFIYISCNFMYGHSNRIWVFTL